MNKQIRIVNQPTADVHLRDDFRGGVHRGPDKRAFAVAAHSANQLIQLQKGRSKTTEIQIMQTDGVPPAAFEPALDGAVIMAEDA